MKYTILIFLIVITNFSVYSYDWNVINQDEEWNTYYALESFDSLHYIISGEYNHFISLDSMYYYTYLKETTDGGYTWKIIFREDDDLINFINPRLATQIVMLSPTTIVAGFEKGMLLRTDNGGVSWDSVFFSTDGPCLTLDFYNGKYGAAFFQNLDSISLTNDSGKTWLQMEEPLIIEYDSLGNIIDTIGSKYGIRDIHFFNDYTFIMLFPNWRDWTNWILKTFDRGKNWIYYKESNDLSANFHFANDSIGFMGGVDNINDRNPFIKKTTDGGLSWKKIWTGSLFGYIYDMSVIDEDTVYAIGNTYVIKTTDGGMNWSYMSLDTTARIWWGLHDIEYGSKSKGLIINNSNVVYSNSIITGIDESELNNIYLNLYPNPMNVENQVFISFNLPSYSSISLVLYNSLGINLSDIFTGFHEAGEHTIQFNPDENLPSGIYWLRMTINGDTQIIKPVVIIQ